jgi:hypothetical protein
MTEDSGYCVPTVRAVAAPTTINCTKVPYITTSTSVSGSSGSVSANKWLCDSYDDVDALLEGPTGSTIVPGASIYAGPNDIICVADDPTTGMYYCQTVADAAAGTQDTLRTDYKATCDTLTKSYMDLSNNLTTIMKAKTTASNSSAQVAAIEVTLRNVIQQMCGATNSGGSSCATLWTYMNALDTNIGSGTGAVSGILNPIQVAVQSQGTLRAMLDEFNCSGV